LVLLNSYAIDNDGHKAVIDTTKFATLAEEATATIKQKANLIDTARAGVHFYTKGGNCSAVKNISSCNKDTDVGTDRQGKAVIDLKKAKCASW
jgi:hypothetical protein